MHSNNTSAPTAQNAFDALIDNLSSADPKIARQAWNEFSSLLHLLASTLMGGGDRNSVVDSWVVAQSIAGDYLAKPPQLHGRSKGEVLEYLRSTVRHKLLEYRRTRMAQKRGSGKATISMFLKTVDGEERSLELPSMEDGPDELAGSAESKRTRKASVDSALASMPPEKVELIKQYFFAGLSAKTIASSLGVSEEVIRQRAKRAKLELTVLACHADGWSEEEIAEQIDDTPEAVARMLQRLSRGE